MSSGKIDRERAAAALKGASMGALRALGSRGDAPACPYPAHRETDWRLRAGGPTQCGVCHPPVASLDTVAVDAR